MSSSFSQRLLDWFDEFGRKDLPWQFNKTPYRVWVSEIMLQQTQVSSVIAYYQRFMDRFPSLDSLANASEDDVLEHWAGLGYYSRARNLLKCAQTIARDYAGDFPKDLEAVMKLPGIGRSTAGAILSIAGQQRHPILDGNVKRVLSRHYAIDTWPGERKTEQALWQHAESLTPHTRVADYTQAIMDLGATLCSRSKPDCQACPVSSDCQAHQQGLQNQLPKPKPRKAIPLRKTWMSHVETPDGLILLEKRPSQGIWGGLYSLPEHHRDLSLQEVVARATANMAAESLEIEQAAPFIHTFSHYKLEIWPLRILLRSAPSSLRDNDTHRWIERDRLSRVGLPAPVAKYLKNSVRENLELALESHAPKSMSGVQP